MYGTLTADGNTASTMVRGSFHVHVQGTWGSGAIAVQYKSADGTWRPIVDTDLPLSADDDKIVEMPGPAEVRLALTGSTAPSLFWEIRG